METSFTFRNVCRAFLNFNYAWTAFTGKVEIYICIALQKGKNYASLPDSCSAIAEKVVQAGSIWNPEFGDMTEDALCYFKLLSDRVLHNLLLASENK